MSPEGPNPEKNSESLIRQVVKWVRRSLALALLIFSIGGLLLDKFRICTTESSSETTLTTCGSPTISDASVVAVMLVFLLLILPDYDEISALGISLKRRIEAVDRRTDQLQSSIAILSTQVSQATASASVVNNLGYLTPDNSLDEIVERLAAKLGHQPTSGVHSPALPDDALTHADVTHPANRLAAEAGPEGTVRALLSVHLIDLWERLQEVLLIGPRYRAARDSGGPASRAHARLAEEFREEIATVRQARNSVAHAQSISTRDIELAVEAAETLIEIARRDLA